MKYYKDINGNIYTGDKADYRDKELTTQEFETYMVEKQKQFDNQEIISKLIKLDTDSVRPLRACIVALLDSKQPDKVDVDKLKESENTVKSERLKIK